MDVDEEEDDVSDHCLVHCNEAKLTRAQKKQDQSVNIQRVIGLLETMKRLFVTYAMDNHQESVINVVEVLSEATRYTYDDGTVKKCVKMPLTLYYISSNIFYLTGNALALVIET